jgi:hypothetical protein
VLVADMRGQAPRPLVPYRRTEFDLGGLQGYSVVFTVDSTGAVTGLAVRQPNGVYTARRLP